MFESYIDDLSIISSIYQFTTIYYPSIYLSIYLSPIHQSLPSSPSPVTCRQAHSPLPSLLPFFLLYFLLNLVIFIHYIYYSLCYLHFLPYKRFPSPIFSLHSSSFPLTHPLQNSTTQPHSLTPFSLKKKKIPDKASLSLSLLPPRNFFQFLRPYFRGDGTNYHTPNRLHYHCTPLVSSAPHALASPCPANYCIISPPEGPLIRDHKSKGPAIPTPLTRLAHACPRRCQEEI